MRGPTHSLEKHDIRRISREIREVLLKVWDPIGVKDVPQAQDEYDCCVGHILSLLAQQKSDDEIVDYLMWAATDHMGLGGAKREDMLPTVQALRAIRIPSPEHT
jgi:hypothetical protein